MQAARLNARRRLTMLTGHPPFWGVAEHVPVLPFSFWVLPVPLYPAPQSVLSNSNSSCLKPGKNREVTLQVVSSGPILTRKGNFQNFQKDQLTCKTPIVHCTLCVAPGSQISFSFKYTWQTNTEQIHLTVAVKLSSHSVGLLPLPNSLLLQ